MRYIGNKTKLLGFIGTVIDELGIETGRAADPFSGTASVAQYLKKRGFETESCDIMSYSYAFQRAYVELDEVPSFARVLKDDSDVCDAIAHEDFHALLADRIGGQQDLFGTDSPEKPLDPLHRILVYLDTFLPPLSSFITREYSARKDASQTEERMFFTRANGRRIDAIRTQLHKWRTQDLLSEDEFYLLLACLLESADSVANTTGVYAAFVKSWQSNALKPLRLQVPELVTGTGLVCRAHQENSNDFVRKMDHVNLVYLDPPYNTRQYSSYYHVPELIADGWFGERPALRGKTGLIPDKDKKSSWSVTGECVAVFRDLIANLDADYVLLSYNSEGIIPAEALEEVFSEFGQPGTFRTHEKDYARYRSDRDHEKRVYQGDRVTEYVFTMRLAHSAVQVSSTTG